MTVGGADPIAVASGRIDARESLRHVLAASVLSLVLWFVPLVGWALYPIRLFVTYVHEICHALASVLTGGWPERIEIYLNTSGITNTLGGSSLVISSAGYVGTPLVGAALLLLSARRWMVRPTLVATGGVLALSSVWLGGNALAWVAGLGIGSILVAIGLKASSPTARFVLSFLAIQCMLNALSDLKFLFWLSMSSPAATDAQNMAQATGGLVPAVVWTVLWAAVALGILGGATWLYYRTTARQSIDSLGQPLLDGAQQSTSVNNSHTGFRSPFS